MSPFGHFTQTKLFVGLTTTLLLLAVSIIGCKSKTPANRSGARGTGDSGEQTLASATVEPVQQAAVVNRLPQLTQVSQPDQDDPLGDGWATEAFSETATQQLNRLGELILREQELTEQVLAEFSAHQFTGNATIPTSSNAVLRDHLIHVQRSETFAPANNLLDALRPLQRWLQPRRQNRHFKFKLYRVQPDSTNRDVVTTEQYVQFSGTTAGQGDEPTAGQAQELNATWTIEWERADDGPRIRSLKVQRSEQVTLRASSLFTDCTSSVLGANASYKTALLPGISHWRERFERQLAVYNFGHHGIAVGDVNGDGLEDLYVCQTGGLPNHLYVQRPDGSTEDVALSAGVAYLDNTRSALFLDLDNDEDQDLVLAVTTGVLFFENDGNGQFQLRARIPSVRQAFSLAAADYDQDGYLDVYVCVYYGSGDTVSQLPVPVPYFDATNGGQNHLLRNHGDWKFTDATELVGLAKDNHRFSFAAAWEDYDQDGDPDLFVINDFGPNHLYRNANGTFTDVAQDVGFVDGAFGMSATFGDFDRDGRSDLYVSNMFSAAGSRISTQRQFKPGAANKTISKFRHLARGNSLFRHSTEHNFEDVSVSQAVTMGRWSWGSLFADVNNDGWDDLLVANGYVTGKSPGDL